MDSILNLDATAQADLIKKGLISPPELVRLAIDAIEELNPRLNAVITPMYEQAMELAEGKLPEAPFKGVPILLKDGVAAYAGVRMTSGSALAMQYIPDEDSTLVTRLKNAGFIIIGKTNMPEFGLLPTTEPTVFGPTRNPWNLNLTPGGSSGGSAAAVAARMVALAHGNDGGGSIRIPASCCGLFGLKPSRGRNPLGPMFSELVSGLVAEHVLTRSVRDSAAVLDLTAGEEPGAFYGALTKQSSFLSAIEKPPRKLKIGFCTTSITGGALHSDCVAATQKAIQICEELGHEVREMPLDLPVSGKKLGEIFGVLWSVCTTSPIRAIERKMGKLPPRELVEPLTWALYEDGLNVLGADYEITRQAMHRVAKKVLAAFNDIDVWISPTLAKPPLPIGSFAQNEEDPKAPSRLAAAFAPMTAIFNISGQPAASVPIYWNENQLPIGVQLVGKFGDEHSILQLSAQMEKIVNWSQCRPEHAIG